MNHNFLNKPLKITEHIWDEGTIPLVSVYNWVYNHKDFIRESIDSILMQETIFPVEIIIHDDASNDGTLDIIKEYEMKYPQLFKNVIQLENQWSQGKSVSTSLVNNPRGKYVALSHGDDYWTDPLKLQKQVDFLENNNNVFLCAHKVNELKYNPILNTKILSTPNFLKLNMSFKDFAKNGCFGVYTAAILYNRSKIETSIILEDWISNLDGEDHLFLLLATIKGQKVIILDEIMGVYRIHSEGVWTKTIQKIKTRAQYTNLNMYLENLKLSKIQRIFISYSYRLSYLQVLNEKLWTKDLTLKKLLGKIIYIGLTFLGPHFFYYISHPIFKKMFSNTIIREKKNHQK